MHQTRVRSALAAAALAGAAALTAQQAEMDGYLGVPNDQVDRTFDGGFSLYVAAWPLLATHPGPQFQTGLFGTWMHAVVDDPKEESKLYSDIEGGLGWWRDTRFPTATPKFIMGGVALNFCAWANGPGAGKGRDWDQPAGKYGVAQLTPWLLWPPDGLNLAQGTCGELFGYGYLPLPLTEPKTTTAGKPVPTGNRCWTLFLNTETFKGPVAFFTPFFFASPTLDKPELAGRFLDSRPANPNRAVQMETQWVPAMMAADERGVNWARVAPTRFPIDANGESVLVHRITSYHRAALWDAVQRWFDGGPEATGRIDAAQALVHRIPGKGWSTWRIYTNDAPQDQRVALDWQGFETPFAPDPFTFGYRWQAALVTKDAVGGAVATLPEYYRLVGDGKAARWKARTAADGDPPAALRNAKLGEANPRHPEAYVTPSDGCWAKPGPVAGPFTARLGDGSTITYCWYRFADQPALLSADLSDAERERLQQRVEKLHRSWREDRDYLPPPERGRLARLDPALFVKPPKGFEAGYVPIVTRQERD
jgi:hypothetical protein